MRIISITTLSQFMKKHSDCMNQIHDWIHIVEKSNWNNPNEVKDTFPYVSLLANNRIVFNIKGNDYRLVVFFKFTLKTVFILWIGTHSEYDKIDANNVWDY